MYDYANNGDDGNSSQKEVREENPGVDAHNDGIETHESDEVQDRSSSAESTGQVSQAGLYEPLTADKREIRLLTILPGHQYDALACTMDIADIDDDDCVKYETMSYCWGDIFEQDHISVNGKQQRVPLSARAALLRVREESAPRVVWIDSVCINQDDPDERGHQVRFMDLIYKRGERNLIYLGGEPQSQVSQDIAKILSGGRFFSVRETFTLTRYSGENLLGHIDYDDSALALFYGNPWFRYVRLRFTNRSKR